MAPHYIKHQWMENVAGCAGWMLGLFLMVAIVAGPSVLTAWVIWHFVSKYW